MKYKLLVENWKKFLKEAEEKKYDASQREVLADLIKEPYSTFVKDLATGVKDPKFSAFLDMGVEEYDGNSQDDVVNVSEPNIPVKDLQPTQSQIGLADSLGFLSTQAPQGGAAIAQGAVKPANVGGRIITANGKYIVDGHHRWSQVYLINPNATIPAYNFEVEGALDSPTGVLKLAHLAIAAVDNAVPLVPADAATDIFATGGNREAIIKILNNPKVVSEELAKVLAPFYKVKTRKEVINRIADHAEALFAATQASAAKGPERGLMPQTAADGKTKETAKVAAMKAGQVNWNPKA
jgi:hypothetical protein